MRSKPSGKIFEILHTIITQFEQDAELGHDDPALTELRRTLLLRIADLESSPNPADAGSPVEHFAPSNKYGGEDRLSILRMR